MRVAVHVDQLWFRVPGGIGTYVWELVPALEHEDATLELVPFSARWRGPPARMWLRSSRAVELSASFRVLYPAWDLLARPRLPAQLRRADVVHATNPAAVPPVHPGQRLVVTVHDLGFERFPDAYPTRWRWLYRAGLRAAARRADAFLTPSSNTADDLVSRVRVDPRRVHVTPLGASLPAHEGDPEQMLTRLGVRRPYVLFVGTLERRKNIRTLVRAYRRVASKGYPHALVLAGAPGWRIDDVEREIATAGPGEIVRTGPLGTEDLDAVYRGADAFVYPSLYEGFGLPVLEAMARGIPTVASNTSSLPEVYGDAAIGVDPTSEEALAGAMERLLSDRGLAEDLARRGRERARGFSWAETARATLRVYRETTGAR